MNIFLCFRPPVSLAMGLSPARYPTGMMTSPTELPPKQEADDGKFLYVY